MKPSSRDSLIDDVRFGRMTPAEAEAEAARLGIGPLERVPDPKKYQPMDESWWTLPMAVAWVAWRDPGQVLECYEPYRKKRWYWQYEEWRADFDGPIYKGHFLKQMPAATLSLLSSSESYDVTSDALRDSSRKIQQAIGLLWKALQDNLLQGTGIPTDQSERTTIADCQWRDLKPAVERGRDVVCYNPILRRGYGHVLLRTNSILALWPEILPRTAKAELPETIRPDGPGYFPLYCAVQWIATEGGSRKFDLDDISIWSAAYSNLMAYISSGEVSVTGLRGGIREKLEGYIFASLRVDYPFAETTIDFAFSEELYLCSYPYVDEEHWQKGFDDSLRSREGIRWSRLMVQKSEVAGHWPFTGQGAQQTHYRTGAPGRPTPMPVIVAEHRRRLDAGEASARVTAEAEYLSSWLKQSHPDLPPITPKAIENKIRTAHRRGKNTPK